MKKKKFCYFYYMAEILNNFCEEHGLELLSASEITWETEEQRLWLERFVDIWFRVEDRDNARRWR